MNTYILCKNVHSDIVKSQNINRRNIMGITVKEALKIWPLTLGQVIAGKNGLDREVTSVSVLEIPKETKWFKGGELQISAFYTIANDVESQLEVLNNLNKSNCSGLVLCHIGHWLKSVPQKLIQLANKINFPVIIVPEHIAYIDIITPITDAILNKKKQGINYDLETIHKMANILLNNKNIDHIIYSLSKSLNKSVLFFNIKNECLTTGNNQISEKLINEIKESILTNVNRFIDKNEYIIITSQLTGISILLVPVIINTKYYGTIAILNVSNLKDIDMMKIAESKYACGLAVIENIRLNELRSSVILNYYTDLIQWNFSNEIQAMQKASTMNLNVSRISLILTIEIFKSYIHSNKINNFDLQAKINEIYNYVIEKIKTEKSINYIMTLNNKIIILINDCGNDTKTITYAQRLGNRLINSIQIYFNTPVAIGIGNYQTSISKIKNSYHESLLAIKIGNALFNKSHCTNFQIVEILSLLFEGIDTRQASSAIKKLFEPLERYDAENNSALTLTLKALINCNFKTSLVAEKLFIHRNTVLQRKNKIIELLQFDPEEFPYRLLYELATILEKMVD